MHFLRAGADNRFDVHKTAHPAATEQGGVMRCTRDPRVGTLVFFASCLNIRRILRKGQKKRQNCNGKRKMPLLVAGLQQQGRRRNRILNKTAERIIMRKKLKKEGRPHGTGISARTVQRPSCGLDERAQHQLTGACQGNRLLQEYHQPLHQRCERNPDP